MRLKNILDLLWSLHKTDKTLDVVAKMGFNLFSILSPADKAVSPWWQVHHHIQ